MSVALVVLETRPGECRVAATPETVRKLIGLGLEVWVEEGAGARSYFADSAYAEAGARLVPPGNRWNEADLVLKVGPLGESERERFRSGAVLVGLLSPYRHPESAAALAAQNVTALAMELVPRITRAQKMDALSSQASIAGYKAVLLAADALPKYFPLLMTAAGTVQPARVVVMGAGVAGLQAIATARRLGAQVEVTDVRPEVKEQVESLGAKFIDLPLEESGVGQGGYARELSADALKRQREILSERVAAADVVITTAMVPGKQAPRLLTAEMVARMQPGSVVVDLAGEAGGNCELSRPDEVVEASGVRIFAPTNLPSRMPRDASQLYARNVFEVVQLLVRDGKLAPDFSDEIVAAMRWTHEGRVLVGQAPVAQGATA
ncbi:MAG: Re/Si-specific NAD(P)(+) transhydrogenase subunit alpha [Pseudomonadota bacterium]|nr:MAG: Re/Si-specific NAD(P)(+) transhydrogenase subunit alpha [Pseudomonadota bacterium]